MNKYWQTHDRYKYVYLMEEAIFDQLLEKYDQCICQGLEGDYLIFSTYNLINEDTDSAYIERKVLKFNCFTGEEIN